MAATTDEISSGVRQLATALLDDIEPIARRSVARLQELRRGYAEAPAEELLPVILTSTRIVLEAVLHRPPDPNRAEAPARVSRETRNSDWIPADDILQAWQTGLGPMRE